MCIGIVGRAVGRDVSTIVEEELNSTACLAKLSESTEEAATTSNGGKHRQRVLLGREFGGG